MKEKRWKNRGFTLIELIIVITIMAVLIGIVVPSYIKYVEKSARQKDVYNAKTLKEILEFAYVDGSISFKESEGKSAVWVFVTRNKAQFFVNGQTVFPEVNGVSNIGVVAELQSLIKDYGIDGNTLKVASKRVKDTGVAGTDEGWNWYCVYMLSNGEIGAVSGPGNAQDNYLSSWGNFNNRILNWSTKNKSALAREIM